MKRSSGILLHITSLPSRYGIGTLGREAFSFVDFLEQAGQKYWQFLPVGPTGFGDSPYQSFSAFAGNPYFIDLELLMEEGLLARNEVDFLDWGEDPAKVDYGLLYQHRLWVLRRAFQRSRRRDQDGIAQFYEANRFWLEDYSLFMAAKEHFSMTPWPLWPDEELRSGQPAAVKKHRSLLAEERQFHVYLQYLFFKQWKALRTYANGKGISLFGDLPLYVPFDSADAWTAPENFQWDSPGRPAAVAGVPPDYFSATGQLWGNVLYDWEAMKVDGYQWWLRRLRAASTLFDLTRIDHFRGIESYWSIPYGEETAVRGRWRKGPGSSFVEKIKEALPAMDIIAEDLGILTPEVYEMLAASGFPGMRVLEFAFDSDNSNDHLPHRYPANCVAYSGTHDNNTAAAWFASASDWARASAERYLSFRPGETPCRALVRGVLSSAANLAIIPMQDYLELGAEARMNTPGTLGGNWQWRLTPGQLTPALAEEIAALVQRQGR